MCWKSITWSAECHICQEARKAESQSTYESRVLMDAKKGALEKGVRKLFLRRRRRCWMTGPPSNPHEVLDTMFVAQRGQCLYNKVLQ